MSREREARGQGKEDGIKSIQSLGAYVGNEVVIMWTLGVIFGGTVQRYKSSGA